MRYTDTHADKSPIHIKYVFKLKFSSNDIKKLSYTLATELYQTKNKIFVLKASKLNFQDNMVLACLTHTRLEHPGSQRTYWKGSTGGPVLAVVLPSW